MKKNIKGIRAIYLYLISSMVLLVIMYELWPLPFEYVSKKTLLPAVNVLTIWGRKILSPVEMIKNINQLELKNKNLENDNELLSSKLAKQDDLNKNCTLLSQEIAKNKNFPNSKTVKIIGRTPGGFNATLLLNQGSNEGIQEGAAVLSNGYYIGRIDKVEVSQSEVMLVFSHNSLIPVIMAKNNEGGLLQGGLEGLSVTDIPISTKIETGDSVITSGLGGDLPSGLLVGKVGVHLGLEGDLFQKVRVDSPINPSQIDYVTILSK